MSININVTSTLTLAMACTLALGCSSAVPTSTRAVTGQLTLSAYPIDNPVVVARSTDGRTFVATVSATGRFSLALPIGQSYRLGLANTTRTSGYVAISRIEWPTGTRWVQLAAGGTVTLGTIRPLTTASSSGLATASAGFAPGSTLVAASDSDHDDDMTSQEETDVDVCHNDESDSSGDADADDGMSVDDDAEHNSDDDAPCASATGSSPAGGPVAPTPTQSSGTGQSGSSCTVNADCGAGLSCVNSVCTSTDTIL